MTLDPEQIHLWCAFFDEIKDERLLAQYRSLLTEQERCRERSFYFTRDRHRYLVTRALERTVLSRYAPIAPEHWSFRTNPYGRPEIANDDHIARKIVFNISHTQSLIVFGVTCCNALGVDTENVRIRTAPIEIAGNFFSCSEVDELHTHSVEARQERFFQYWTLKESYIKARGMGLSIPLDQFAFHIQEERRISVSMQRNLNDFPARWRFWQLRLSANYIIAVCADRSNSSDQQLVLKKVVPLGEEQVLNYSLLLSSE